MAAPDQMIPVDVGADRITVGGYVLPRCVAMRWRSALAIVYGEAELDALQARFTIRAIVDLGGFQDPAEYLRGTFRAPCDCETAYLVTVYGDVRRATPPSIDPDADREAQ